MWSLFVTVSSLLLVYFNVVITANKLDIPAHISAQVIPQQKLLQNVSEEATKFSINGTNSNNIKDPKNNVAALETKDKVNDIEKHSETTLKPSDANDTLSFIPKRMNYDILQSGALMRGFFVFLGLSMLIILYLFFRSYRSVKNIEHF